MLNQLNTTTKRELDSRYLVNSGSKEITTSGTILIPDYGLTESIEMFFKPSQDLHGYNKPWAGGAGKNKFDISQYNTTNFSLTNDTLTNIKTDAGSDTIALWVRPMFQGVAQSPIRTLNISENGNVKTTINITQDDIDAIRLVHNGQTSDLIIEDMPWVSKGTYTLSFNIEGHNPSVLGGFVISNIQIEQGTDASTFEPYANICPISGQDKATFSWDNTERTMNFGTTYYGGIANFDGTIESDWQRIASYNGESLSGKWLSDRDKYVAGTTPTRGAEVVYKTTPTTIRVAPPTSLNLTDEYPIEYNGYKATIKYQPKDTILEDAKGYTNQQIAKLGIPQPPITDGTYNLECTVSSGTPTIRWVSTQP